ncbi:MAG: histidine phosphatase family protein [Pseudomonadota bacterium]|nr:histidine phosphatase family protein [Pseudomonadota bacterium]
MSAGPTLWLVRHAPVLAEAGLCYGSADLPADAQATSAAAQALAAWLPAGLAVSASPLRRCAHLAGELQALRPDLVPKTDARLRELDFGAWEGLRWADIARADFDRWLADFVDAPPGQGGEPVRALMTRVCAAWNDWRASGADALWVTHAGVMRAALLLSRGACLPASAADWPADAMPFGGVLAVHAPSAY